MTSFRRNSLYIFLTAALLVLSACTPKGVIMYVPDDLAQKISAKNEATCSYKGRVSVVYQKGEDDVRFKGYLDKDCSDNFKLKILGLFNTVAYDVTYMDGEVQAFKKDEDVSLEIAYFMRSKGLDSMISLIRYPHVKVDNSFKKKAVGDEFILTKGLVTVAAGADYLIRRISFGEESFAYSYEEDTLNGLTYTGDGMTLEIKLR
ncbi:MAG: hypothetical protein AB7E76_00735 [Deferribacterales bacterium]